MTFREKSEILEVFWVVRNVIFVHSYPMNATGFAVSIFFFIALLCRKDQKHKG
jgi:hypothetical protein